MKLKFTLQRSGLPASDLVATVDSATTVGDLADYLARSDSSNRGRTRAAESVTLALVGSDVRALESTATLGDSGLRSGGVVSLAISSSQYRDPSAGAAAMLVVVDGPDRGKEFPLHTGANVVGRERGSEVRLSDSLVSRQHARINVSDVVEIVDLGSANGITIGDAIVPRAVLRPADVVTIGDTVVMVRRLQAPRAAGTAEGSAVAFVRSPRLDPHFAGQTFVAPEPPERAGKQRFPVIVMLAPLLMGGLLYLITRSWTSIVFVAISPLMLVGNALESRMSGRTAYKRALKEFRADVDAMVAEARACAVIEIAARNREHPAIGECVNAVRQATPLLWTRRPGEPGFGELRLGVGRQPSRSTIDLPDAHRAARAIYQELVAITAEFTDVDGVPVVARPLELGALGIAGPRAKALEVAYSVVVHAAALHSPAELVVAGFASSGSSRDWDWLKWLPHTTSPHSPLAGRQLAASAPASMKLLSELEDLVTRRRDDRDNRIGSLPLVLVVVEDDSPAEHSRLVELAEAGWRQGVIVLWVAGDVAALPAACRTFVDVVGAAAVVGFIHDGSVVTPLAVDSLNAGDAHEVARRLAPIVDVGARVDDDSDLPRTMSLLTLTGPQLAASPEAVLERWNENRSILTGPAAPPQPPKHAGTLRAVIGQAAGEPLALDLRTDGPHALVGGTTGSGKSELLQAWILAMASAHSPQRLTFLLVDYKGGSAFRDCVRLPHTIGLVTDLSPHLVRRALTSLSAELRYREHVLATHQAKDLQTLEKRGLVDAPPSLVIVVDEFAALVAEVPEFVDGVVNVAQRGRSLGLHLILATQRPAGVIKDNLRANTNLRLALRMADEADSTDVLGSPEAAFFDQALPGRAVSKTGPGRLVPFQTGYAGGWTSDVAPAPEILVEELGFGVSTVWEPLSSDVVAVDPGPSDIERLVHTVVQATDLAKIPAPRKPWLPELKALYDLADQGEVPSRRRDTELVFGIRDDPDNQAQPTVAFFPDRDGNLAVYGTGGSGKSTLLRTLAIAAGFTVRGGPCHVYGLDFGARGLSMLEELPHVGSIIAGSDHERLTRLIGWLRGLIDERAVRYSRVNAGTITDYRHLAEATDEPRIILLVDGIAAFRQAYESSDRLRWFEMFTSLAADGRPVGVHVVLSSDQRSGMTTALASAVQARVVLRLASPDDYSVLNVPGDVLGVSTPPGRGLLGDAETQVAVLGGSTDVVSQAVAVQAFADSMRRAGASAAPPIDSLPERITAADLPRTDLGRPVLGVSSTTLGPFTIEPRGSFIIAGPPGTGRSTALLTLVQGLRAADPTIRLYYFGNRRSPLAGLAEWTERVYGSTDIADAATRLAADLRNPDRFPGSIAVVIEGAGEFAAGPADFPLQDLARACLSEDAFIVVEGETSAISGQAGFLGTVKGGRAGLAFGPDQSDGTTLFRTNFPRIDRSAFPPGRAMYVALGKTEVVQIALPSSNLVG